MKHGRRSFALGLGTLAMAGVLGKAGGVAAAPVVRHDLRFMNLHTGETAAVVYRAEGRLIPSALRKIDHLLRDHRTNEVAEIDPRLLDLLHRLRLCLGTSKPYGIISGYRSPGTNAMLVSRSNGVARRSLHMQGRAIDIRIEGVDPWHIYRAARELNAGGVGLYSSSGFVHLDTGRARFWGS